MIPAEKTPVLIYTDVGRDVDDLEAIAYLAGSPNVEIVGLATTGMVPDRRAFIARAIFSNLNLSHIPIGVGSIFPLGQENKQLNAYLDEHTVNGVSYEGEGLIECFPTGEQVITNAIQAYGSRLVIAALAPLTDIAKIAKQDPDLLSTVGGLYIQGQALIQDGVLYPDPAAYNIREDIAAAETVFALQDKIPMTLVGKYAAYQQPLTRSDFSQFAATGNPVGHYLKIHAMQGLTCFAKRSPDVFTRVFGIEPSRVGELTELSMPYDALVAKAITNPLGLRVKTLGHHTLLGMSAASHGVIDPTNIKADLMNTILDGLTRR